MADNAINNIGRVKVTQSVRSTIVAQNFAPKPNVKLNEIVDVNTDGVQNGFVLSYSSATNKYETQSFANVSATISQISGGTF